MLVERKDAELKALFTPLLKDLAYTSQKIARCSGVEAKAIDELWQSCFLSWLEDPNYKLTHVSKKDKEYRIATCGRFVTLVTPKDDWPIIFTARHQKKVPGAPPSAIFIINYYKYILPIYCFVIVLLG